jgi:hypothetical protein
MLTPPQAQRLPTHWWLPPVRLDPDLAAYHLRRWLIRGRDECYFYLEKFSMDHKYAMKGVFLMELEEDNDPTILVEDLGISLHALTGLLGTNTTQLMINVTGIEHRALVDSGSTHMFFHDVVAHRLGLQVML